MKIHVMSKKMIELVDKNQQYLPNSIAICITAPVDDDPLHNVGVCKDLHAILRLKFDDCDEGNWNFMTGDKGDVKLVPMSPQDAKDVFDFVEQMKSITENIYIACYAGISRSAGVGAALCRAYGWDDTEIYKHCVPNVHVLSVMKDEWNRRQALKEPIV